MAKAAYCAACGANVYLNDEGLCPQGHPVDQLSNFYDAPDLTPAEHAQYDAVAPVERRKMNKTLMIVLIVLGVFVLCGIGTCVAGVIGWNSVNEMADEVTDTSGDEVIIDDTTDPTTDGSTEGGTSSASFDPDAELPAMTSYFFPGFSPTTYYSVGEETAEPAKYQIVTYSDDVTDFTMIYTALRFAGGTPGSSDGDWVYYADNGAAWQRQPDYEGDPGVSLGDFAGANAAVDSESRAEIMAQFSSAHPSKIVSDFEVGDTGSFIFKGFDESELDDWMGDTTSFTSQWDLNVDAGKWVETNFTE